MKQENIIQLKATRTNLDDLKVELAEKKQEFEEQNSELIEKIEKTTLDLNGCIDQVKVSAMEEFRETGEKKLLGGIGIRILTSLKYDEQAAIDWADAKMPVALKTILDKKQFETYAKSTDLDFVKKVESICVTIPKVIEI